jgi:hypothetical protein
MNIDDEKHDNFVNTIKKIEEKIMKEIEVRVRMEDGEVLGIICGKIGKDVYKECKEYVLRLIKSNMERKVENDDG